MIAILITTLKRIQVQYNRDEHTVVSFYYCCVWTHALSGTLLLNYVISL